MTLSPFRFFVASSLGTGLLLALASPAAAEGFTLTIDQENTIESTATWTLGLPNHESIERSHKSLTLTELYPGNYTLFVTPPNGTVATLTLYEGETVLEQVNHQLSFKAAEGQVLRILIVNTLVNTGKVSINSEPAGVPFTIRGPNKWTASGVTPHFYDAMPVGNYSVQFEPEGCTKPAAKSDLLLKNGRADFFLELSCTTFIPALEIKDTHMQTEVGGQAITFTDVPVDAWFSPFVKTASNRGFLSGYRDEGGNLTGRFGPANNVTLAELAKIAHEIGSMNELEISGAPRNPLAIGQWHTRYIVSAEQRGWLVFQDPTADLNRPATRGEVMITLLQGLDLPMQWAKGGMFKDVTPQTPYAHAIETIARANVVSGSTDTQGNSTGFFYPENTVTRAELSRILINAYEKFLRREMPLE